MSDPSSSELDAARDQLKAQAQASEYLTVDEAAALARCAAKTIRRAFESGALTGFRPAHRVLFRSGDVRAWIEGTAARGSEPHPWAKPPAPKPKRRSNGKPAPGSVAALREIERKLTR